METQRPEDEPTGDGPGSNRSDVDRAESANVSTSPHGLDIVAGDEVDHPHTRDDDVGAQDIGNENSDDDGDDITVILLDHTIDDGNDRNNGFSDDWIEQHGPEMEERRRSILLRELKRIQRTSFIHFALLCFIPTALLVIVLVTILSEEEVCESTATYCALERRTFVNAFTTRCVCDPIPIARSASP